MNPNSPKSRNYGPSHRPRIHQPGTCYGARHEYNSAPRHPGRICGNNNDAATNTAAAPRHLPIAAGFAAITMTPPRLVAFPSRWFNFFPSFQFFRHPNFLRHSKLFRHSGESRNLRARWYDFPSFQLFRHSGESRNLCLPAPLPPPPTVIPAKAGIYAVWSYSPSFRLPQPSFRRKPESTRLGDTMFPSFQFSRHSGASRNLRATMDSGSRRSDGIHT